MDVSTNTGKVEIVTFYNIEFQEPTEIERKLIEKVSEVVYNYYPG